MLFTVKADIKDLEKKMADAAKQTETFAKKSTTSFDNVGKSIKKLSGTSVDFGGNLVKGFKDAATAADGFKDVAGNTLEGFGEGAKQAASALGPIGSIVAGIGIAVVTALATAVIGDWIDSIGEATAAVKQLAEIQKTLNDIQSEGNKNAAKETTSLKILYDSSQNVNLSMADRFKAAKALQDQWPGTFKNYTQEQITLGEAATAYKNLTEEIIKQARAKAALGKLQELAGKSLDLEIEKRKVLDKSAKDIGGVKQRFVSSGSSSGGSSLTGGGGVSNDVIITKNEQINKILDERDPKLKKINDDLKENLATQTAITNMVGAGNLLNAAIKPDKELKVKTLKIKPDKVEIEKVGKAFLKSQENFNNQKIGGESAPALIVQTQLPFINSFSAQLKEGIQNRLKDLEIGFNKNDAIEKLSAVLKAAEDKIKATQNKVLNDLNAIIDSTFQTVAIDFASAIGSGLGGGNIDGIFDGLLKSLAGGIKKLGQSLVQTYLLVGLIKKVGFKNPATAVAAGLALIALGSFIEAKLAKTPAFANGVQNFGGGVALVGERGPELVNLPRGADVIPNNQLGGRIGGGSGDMNVSGQFTVRGTDLVAVLDKANNRINRNS